ncbi:transketolase C-terminal domain-containing protein [Bdellovibrio svalbardensis]|uniref:Thiamine pyrophosphate-dependent enzyme n=1 Tax=Bdellovibrio svalbardensis TaxID=2972972 RepID=A0ABT6DEN4_9BACT|nr:transketolase C-terminal domain-containing protein [Bdellovibrio svalbardensis]MDG0815288.1 thiamine pyrophosphate-dependent enzyme [Bdellovibrio svalbardensis]
MTEPIQIKTKLAGNPSQEPQFKSFVKSKDGRSIPVADPRSTRALVSLMDMNAVLGGAASHYGGPAAFAELMSALHGFVFDVATREKKQWFDLFHIVNDAGHCENGLYALKANYNMAGLTIDSLKKFRSIESGLTGHGEVHCFPEGVFVSNGPLGSAFPQTQGLAMGEAFSGKNRVTITAISDGASMEGEAKEAYAAIPGLAQAGKLAPYVLLISDNNTKLSGRIDQESFSMNPSFESLKALGWKIITLADGNNLQKCFDAIAEAVESAKANPKVPVAIWAKTIKGIGTKKTAESASGGHGFPLKSPSELPAFLSEIYGGEALPAVYNTWIDELNKWEADIKAKAVKDSGEKIQTGISSAMVRARKAGLPVLSVTSDLPGSTGVAGFRKEFPQDSFDVGVAESNMVSAAAGLSKLGYIPVVDTFAQFGVTKGALPLTMGALSEAPIVAVFSHTGFQDAADGASHQALSYMAMVSSIPHVDVYSLSCSEEADALMFTVLENFAKDRKAGKVPNSSIFFLGRENFPKTYVAGTAYDLKKAQVLADTTAGKAKSVTIATTGSLVPQALEAAKQLETQGVGAVVVNCANVNHVDVATFKTTLAKTQGRLVTVEDHQVIGGFGQMLAHALLQAGVEIKLKSLGVHGEFGQSSYTALELYKKHKVDASAIVTAAL